MTLAGRRLAILTEGGRTHGLGHVVRCGAYAEQWLARGGEVKWRIEGDDLALEAASGLGEARREAWRDTPADPEADALLVDSYALTSDQAEALAATGQPLVFIDDLQPFPYPAGLVVHAAPDPAPLRPDAAEWLTGPRWQPLRRAFRAPPSRQPARETVARVLVVLGGSDARDLSAEVAAAVAAALPGAEVRLAGGAEAPEGVIPLGRLEAGAMAAEMAASDLAVSAAGQTIFELARCGAPTVMLGVASNQRPNLDGWPSRAGFLDAGMWDAPDLAGRLARACEELHPVDRRQAISKRAMAAVDGQGAPRLIDRLEARWRTH